MARWHKEVEVSKFCVLGATPLETDMYLYIFLLLLPLFSAVQPPHSNFYKQSASLSNGFDLKFNIFRGKNVLITNVASECGYTDSHYKGLVALDSKYGDSINIVVFPCNQFGSQEPLSNEEIFDFTRKTYNAQFLVMGKIDVNGPETHPLYTFLKEATNTHTDIAWNFSRYYFVDSKVSEPTRIAR